MIIVIITNFIFNPFLEIAENIGLLHYGKDSRRFSI